MAAAPIVRATLRDPDADRALTGPLRADVTTDGATVYVGAELAAHYTLCTDATEALGRFRRENDVTTLPDPRVLLFEPNADAPEWTGPLSEFLAENEELDPDEVRNTLADGGVYRFGGGAAPAFELILSSDAFADTRTAILKHLYAIQTAPTFSAQREAETTARAAGLYGAANEAYVGAHVRAEAAARRIAVHGLKPNQADPA